jgi:hypothetical protein
MEQLLTWLLFVHGPVTKKKYYCVNIIIMKIQTKQTVTTDLLLGHNLATILICNYFYVFYLFSVDENSDFVSVGYKISNINLYICISESGRQH